ncbi:MAG TPA: hypothetical protein VIV60_01025, partial [Polyangiaceae bacterium]
APLRRGTPFVCPKRHDHARARSGQCVFYSFAPNPVDSATGGCFDATPARLRKPTFRYTRRRLSGLVRLDA